MKLQDLIDSWLAARERRDKTHKARMESAAAADQANKEFNHSDKLLQDATTGPTGGCAAYSLADGRNLLVTPHSIQIIEPQPIPDVDVAEKEFPF